MNSVTPAQLRLAQWLLQQESAGRDEPAAAADAAALAWDKLSPRLANIFTIAGTHGIAKRAIYLAQRNFPLLRGVEGEMGLNGLRGAMAEIDESEAAHAAAAVLANVIALSVTFIGEDLSLRAIRDVWPDAPLGEEDPLRQEASL